MEQFYIFVSLTEFIGSWSFAASSHSSKQHNHRHEVFFDTCWHVHERCNAGRYFLLQTEELDHCFCAFLPLLYHFRPPPFNCHSICVRQHCAILLCFYIVEQIFLFFFNLSVDGSDAWPVFSVLHWQAVMAPLFYDT